MRNRSIPSIGHASVPMKNSGKPLCTIVIHKRIAAATILPAQSEALLAYQVSISPDAVVQPVAVATLGNVLGAKFNWWLGRLTENLRAKQWFPVNEKQLHKAERFYGRYARYSLLLSWVPIIGDPITIVAGILREPLCPLYS